MPRTIDDATYDDTIRRPWHVPGEMAGLALDSGEFVPAHELLSVAQQGATPAEIARDSCMTECDSPCGGWNRSAWTDDDREPIDTEPGELDDTQRGVDSLGLWLVFGTIGAVALVAVLAKFWDSIVGWGF